VAVVHVTAVALIAARRGEGVMPTEQTAETETEMATDNRRRRRSSSSSSHAMTTMRLDAVVEVMIEIGAAACARPFHRVDCKHGRATLVHQLRYCSSSTCTAHMDCLSCCVEWQAAGCWLPQHAAALMLA
jgi:hypothetical protein